MPESEVGLQRISSKTSFAKNFVKRAKTDVLNQQTNSQNKLLTEKIETFTKNSPPAKRGDNQTQLWAVIWGHPDPFFALSAHKNSQNPETDQLRWQFSPFSVQNRKKVNP